MAVFLDATASHPTFAVSAEALESRTLHTHGQHPHILCINHAPDTLALIKILLEGEAFRVTTHARLPKDLETIVHLAPDVMIVDYIWTHADDPWDLLAMLTVESLTIDPRTHHIPLILCTGAVREVRERHEHLTTMGVQVILEPFDIDHLLQLVHEALDRGPQRLTETSGSSGRDKVMPSPRAGGAVIPGPLL